MKHSSRNILLKISPQQNIEEKFYSQTKENNIVENAEQIFHETFSNEFFNLMENVLNSNGDTNSINDHNENPVVPVVNIEVCYIRESDKFILKHRNQTSLFLCFSCLFVQGINPDSIDERLNFILPGCLTPFKDEICKMFAIEKRKFLANKRFFAVFQNTSLQPVFSNRQNLKKLVSRSKVN